MDQKPMNFESSFNIDRVTFDNVSEDFERKFKERYSKSLQMMSDSRDPMTNASGANSLGILEKMAQKIKDYDSRSDFEESYHQMLKVYERFTET
ncbi:MAG: hypothetical protein N2484_12705 [Clostridia bacterium]|nr:hypothetical protein [Clostridia bacterium]